MFRKIKVWFLYCLPHHRLTRIMHRLTHSSRTWGLRRIMKWFVRSYHIRLEEARDSNLDNYPTMNAFFTRALKPDARPIDNDPALIVSPVDGAVSQLGRIDENRIYQAKKHNYTLEQLLGNLHGRSEEFMDGSFATIYLSPKDYHRVHMPYSGKLREMIHVPGRLFSVAPAYVENVPGLFARNERVVSIFDTEIGPMAVILVGAIFVGSMETVWAGTITPPAGERISIIDYSHSNSTIELKKGDEMGRFNMGSTVILLFGNRTVEWNNELVSDTPVTLGRAIASLKP